MLESVMIIRLATGAMVEVVVPFGVSKAGFLSGCPVELGVVAASKEGTEDAEFHAGVGADGGYTHSTRILGFVLIEKNVDLPCMQPGT